MSHNLKKCSFLGVFLFIYIYLTLFESTHKLDTEVKTHAKRNSYIGLSYPAAMFDKTEGQILTIKNQNSISET